VKFKYKFRLDKRRKLDNGTFPIKVNLHSYNEGRNFDFSIPDYFTSNGDVIKLVAKNKEDFEKIWSKKEKINNFGEITGEEYVTGRRNDVRTALKIKEDALKEIIERKDVITSKDVKRAFLEHTPKKVSSSLDLIKCFDDYHSPLEKQERFSYATSIMATRNNIESYLTRDKVYKPISLYDITSDWLNQYETDRSKVTGSDSVNSDTKNIRTVYNYFKRDNEVLTMKYPFGLKKNNKYQIKQSKKKNVALELDQIERIFNFSSENYWYQMARDFWIFSYLAGGMNLKDMLYWTKDKLKKRILR